MMGKAYHTTILGEWEGSRMGEGHLGGGFGGPSRWSRRLETSVFTERSTLAVREASSDVVLLDFFFLLLLSGE